MDTGRSLDLVHELAELSAGRLQPRDDIREPDWRFWERRNLNLHRVVALCRYAPPSARELAARCRDTLALHFRCAWWRGLGFGVVVELREAAGFPEEYLPLVDGRANGQGTWQWLILVSGARRQAWGLHTWIEGYLSPLYRGVLDRLDEQGYSIESVRKEKDGLMRVLTAARPARFPEFEDDRGASRRPA